MWIRWIAGPVVLAAALVGCGPTAPTWTPPKLAEREPDTPPEVVAFDAPDADVKELARGNNEFTLDLFKKVSEGEKGNIVLSPYSVRTALAMAYAGAGGETKAEMAKALRFTLPDDRLHGAVGTVAASMQTAGQNRPYELTVANTLWPQQGLTLLPGFLDTTNRHYAAAVRAVDFNQPEAARRTINERVKEQTRDRIPELFQSGVIDTDTVLVLTNALFFQGRWKTPFEKRNTEDRDFETELGKKVRVPTMYSNRMTCRVAEANDFRLLELPYRGDRWRMVVLLPTERCGLAAVERGLTADRLTAGFASLQPSGEEVSLYLPKFTHRFVKKLNKPLDSLGMRRAFTAGQANFGGMTTAFTLFLSHVVHEAAVEVDETGTVAAAATGATWTAVSKSKPDVFRADHPFLYFLYDGRSGEVLLIGRVSKP